MQFTAQPYWLSTQLQDFLPFMQISVLMKIVLIAAFSKRFVGAGHSEEGGGPGSEGTLPSAHRACTFRGVWGHSPSEIL